MNNPNALLQTQREHSGRSVRRSHVLLAISLTLLGLLVVACRTPTTNTTSPQSASTRPPQ